ncbi:hypothetical protein QCB44_02625 [Thiomicrorhabdus sp. zzn3]|uniref:hypothetical protein n=1 Tax=Thiomicrorhabdus sp. zzn3 TaxID=3039775 RepID=UPI0024372D41|nr:hypothetical protein [Thiomicrorhabdus sp. zzn3]MDG6777593.1 hypothetical protein [Thiomicrorhabdus sp. zzn3]
MWLSKEGWGVNRFCAMLYVVSFALMSCQAVAQTEMNPFLDPSLEPVVISPIYGELPCCGASKPNSNQSDLPASVAGNTGSHQDQDLLCITVMGTASTEGVDEAFARQMAIRNGLTFASLNHNVSVASDQAMEGFDVTRDATRFTSHTKIKSYQILEEGLEEPFDQYGEEIKRALHYRVKMRVCLTDDPQYCENLAANLYQPRLAIAPLVVADSYQARDISNLLAGYQTELNRRLSQQGYRNLTVLKNRLAVDPNQLIAPNLSPEVLEPIRDQSGAQFVLLSVLRSVSMHEEDSPNWNQVKRFYNLEVKPDSRYLEVDWYIVDLMKRTVVHQQRGGFDVKGDVRVGRERPFGSNAFFATDTGMAFHALLHKQVEDVVAALRCQPLETQIIDVRNNEYVLYLNAASGVKVGDQLAVYQRQGRGVEFQGVNLGHDEVPGAFIKVKRILPRFAVAELVGKKGVIQVGDRVRPW